MSIRLRRPPVLSATSRSPPTSAVAPGIGTRPSARASRPPTVSTSSSSGSSTSNSSPRSSTGSRAVTRMRRRPAPRPAAARRFVLVGDLADDLLEDVLDGDQAGGAAVLVDDDRDVDALGLHLAQQLVDRLGLRHEAGVRITSSTVGRRRSAASWAAADEVLEVDDADHVVDVLADHRDPGEAAAQRQGERLAHGLARARSRPSRCAAPSPRGRSCRRARTPSGSSPARRARPRRAARPGRPARAARPRSRTGPPGSRGPG